MQAKRDALEAVGKKQQEAENRKREKNAKRAQNRSHKSANAQEVERESLQKSLQSRVSEEEERNSQVIETNWLLSLDSNQEPFG